MFIHCYIWFETFLTSIFALVQWVTPATITIENLMFNLS